MITKNLIRNLRSEKVELLNEISELKYSINQLNIKRKQLLIKTSSVDRDSESNYVIDGLSESIEDDTGLKDFEEYFEEEDEYVNDVRDALFSNEL